MGEISHRSFSRGNRVQICRALLDGLTLAFAAFGLASASVGGGIHRQQSVTLNHAAEMFPFPELGTSHEESNASILSNQQTIRTFESILAGDWDELDATVLPNSIHMLKERGAHRCWHKHSNFLEHLVGVHNILRLWGQGETIGRVGLFHSAYSNSYVNLALFDPATEREIMIDLVGEKAETLVHMFCIIDRQAVVVNTLLKQGFIPRDGLIVPHLRYHDQEVYLSPETLRLLVVFTMADIADQYFGWQDLLFGGGGMDGSMIIPGTDQLERHNANAMWPGVSKPGLWMSYLSDLAQVARTYDPTWNAHENRQASNSTVNIPPVFENCTKRLSVENEAAARDLYWNVVTRDSTDHDATISILKQCIEMNPWAFEPWVMLAQKHLHKNDFDASLFCSTRALELQHVWGTAWDKRLSFGAWVAWTRVLKQRSEKREPWPTNSWEVNNLGLVR